MVNMDNVTTIVTGWGSRKFQCTCERCGRKYTLSRLSNRTSPLCGRCQNNEARERSAYKRQVELNEAYVKGYADALKEHGIKA